MKNNHFYLTSAGLLLYCFFAFKSLAANSELKQQSFDEIDQMIEQQFQNKSAQIDELYNAFGKAIDDAFKGITKKIKVEWPNDIKLPSKSTWVGYSKNLKTRSIVNYQRGELVIETKVENKNIAKAKQELDDMAQKMSANNVGEVEQLDIFSKTLNVKLLEQGIKVDPPKPSNNSVNFIKQLLPEPATVADAPYDVVKKSNIQRAQTTTKKIISQSINEQIFDKHKTDKQVVNKPNSDNNVADITKVAAKLSAVKNATLALAPATKYLRPKIVITLPTTSTKKIPPKALTNLAKQENSLAIAKQIETPTIKTVSNPPPPTALKQTTAPQVKLELVKDGKNAVLKMTIKFVNNYQKVLLAHNFDDVKKFSAQYDVPISVILAIVETESSYNPRAISNVPAFGLMQLVPKTAGMDAHNYVYGKKKLVSPDFLFDETNNLQLGTAYFKILKSRYLRKIKDPKSRFYCAIASYNTGVGNLAKTFTGKKNLTKAAAKINKMTSEQVYQYLMENLPAQETKNYLKKIVLRRAKYKHFDSELKES
ncbi:MAG: hypothetical protein COB35_02560 [Gammaproteobacteria bacterium]|nr:MAG: hypothetical protein COB35_02560 [Gammaproteobacteria bacterium]